MTATENARVVLLREPARALGSRLGYRVLLCAAWVLLALAAPWTWLALVAIVIASFVGLLAIFAVVNVVKNRRVLLQLMDDGSVQRPRSVQEILLGRATETVVGTDIVVTPPSRVTIPGKADPYVHLRAGDTGVYSVPLYGRDREEWVADTNELLAGRGVVLRYVELETATPPHGDDADGDDETS